MSAYRRFVSYMYDCRHGHRQKNCGFLKVEVRGSRCLMVFQLKSAPCQELCNAYLCFRGMEPEYLFLHKIPIHQGNAQFKLETSGIHMMGSPYGFSQCCGILCTDEKGNDCYTCWDKKGVLPPYRDGNEVNLVGTDTGTNSPVGAVTDNINTNSPVGAVTDNINTNSPVESVTDNITTNFLAASVTDNNTTDSPIESVTDKNTTGTPNTFDTTENTVATSGTVENAAATSDTSENPIGTSDTTENSMGTSDPTENTPVSANTIDGMAAAANIAAETTINYDTIDNTSVRTNAIEYNSIDTSTSDDTSPPTPTPKTFSEIWAHMQEEFPPLDPFEDNAVLEGIRISPSDLGYLQSLHLDLGTNQFLLHGYRCYHHLLMGRLHGQFQYVIGVPGIYDPQEQFMAKMFGFPCFKPIRESRQKNGQFGYWMHCFRHPR